MDQLRKCIDVLRHLAKAEPNRQVLAEQRMTKHSEEEVAVLRASLERRARPSLRRPRRLGQGLEPYTGLRSVVSRQATRRRDWGHGLSVDRARTYVVPNFQGLTVRRKLSI